VVLDEFKQPLSKVSIQIESKNPDFEFSSFTTTNTKGAYFISVPEKIELSCIYEHIGFKKTIITIELKEGENLEFNPVLSLEAEQISEVIISSTKKTAIEGVVNLDPETIRNTPSANAGIESLLKSLPGVSNNNELSSQYNVRGGNFDENLVYVNEIEVYRPFLIRSGEQEGLSFTNTDMVENVVFSAGGFQAKYGDKLSSVLDITYKTPLENSLKAELSLLGGQVTLAGISKNKKNNIQLGVRYRNNSLLVNTTDTESNYNPYFVDIQSFITRNLNDKWKIHFLGNIALNVYNFSPLSRTTNFGTISSPKALTVIYEGNEQDRYQTLFGAFKSEFQPNKKTSLRWITSMYHTQEQENYDILAQYLIGDVNTLPGSANFGEIESIDGVGAEFSHARNYLDALIFNIEHRGDYKANNQHLLEWGMKYTQEDIRDQLDEYEFLSDSGFFINQNTLDDTPNNPFDNPNDDLRILPQSSLKIQNNVTTQRFSGFGQWNYKTLLKNHQLWLTTGVRFHHWKVNTNGESFKGQSVFSPRFQTTLKPDWKHDFIFRLSTGVYHQPPFYREMRALTGEVQPEVKAQKSYHVVLGKDYHFKLWKRPFKLTSEVYYKHLNNVNTYTLENVRLRYFADNLATAYSTGIDTRINGEFIEGTESWVSLGYLKTEENYNNKGYISRPTDQRLKFGMLFQDYVKSIPNLKMYLNLSYQTGVPGGSPSYADPYDFQSRLRDYKRVDIGTFYQITNPDTKKKEQGFLRHFKSLELGVELFNIFNFKNSITNIYVKDVRSDVEVAIPNYLTGRILNVKTRMEF